MKNVTNSKEVNLAFDEAIETIKENRAKDQEILDKFIPNIAELFVKEIENNNDFRMKHGFLSCSTLLTYLSQFLFDNEEGFKEAVLKNEKIAINRMIKSISPRYNDETGEVIEEDKELTQLSLVDAMLMAASTIDYTFWKTDLNTYADVKNENESK